MAAPQTLPRQILNQYENRRIRRPKRKHENRRQNIIRTLPSIPENQVVKIDLISII